MRAMRPRMRSISAVLAAMSSSLLLAACGGGGGGCPKGQMTCNGSCVDTAIDRANCGACGAACASGQVCTAGACATECPAGSLLCGAVCVDPMADDQNCGACGTQCPAGTACSGGTCARTCGTPLTQCGSGATATCTNTKTDPGNCGACGSVCLSGQVCDAGKCVTACGGASTACGGACVDLQTDDANCGKCGNACAAGTVCQAGTCATTCSAPYTTCGSGPLAYCANLLEDPANCGKCGTACASGQVCDLGACTTACGGASTACGGACVDLQTDGANCGSCGHACPAGQACATGACVATCGAPLTTCSGTGGATFCADLMHDPANCGGCGTACATGNVCSAGTCASSCAGATDTACAGSCVDLQTDNQSCGSCGHPCPAGEVCSAGACAATCYGATLCTGSTGKYCANLGTDPANCGGCGTPCPAGEFCIAGACSLVCASGTLACGSECTDILNDPNHCGACGNACGPGQGCVAGSCVGPLAFWPFEGSALDMTGNGNSGTVSGATFVAGYAMQGLSFNGTSSDVSAPFIDLTNKSFTVEAWVNGAAFGTGDRTILAQCASQTTDKCLHLTVRNGTAYMGFYNDDTPGSTILGTGTWNHLAFVYDASSGAQIIYVNGVADALSLGHATYAGTSGGTTIGDWPGVGSTFFNGLLDEVKVYDYARTGAEILDDASLAGRYTFDEGSTVDSGPNHLAGTASGTGVVAGRLGQALSYNGSTTYFEASGYTALGTASQPFSVELWVKPNIDAGVLVHAAQNPDGGSSGWCHDLLGFTSPGGKPVAQVWSGTAEAAATAPTALATGAWSHLAATWSPTNGVRLYVDGTLVSSASASTYAASGAPDSLFLGSAAAGTGICNGGAIFESYFNGAIDDLEVYSRERSSAEIAADANP